MISDSFVGSGVFTTQTLPNGTYWFTASAVQRHHRHRPADDLGQPPPRHLHEVGDEPAEVVVGPTGRSKRNQEAEEL